VRLAASAALRPPRLHECGALVAVNMRGAERAETIAREIGQGVLAVAGDIAADGVPHDVVARTLDRFGRIDILVNNAALPLTTRFEQISAEEWRQAMEVNLAAPFLLIQAALPAMSMPAAIWPADSVRRHVSFSGVESHDGERHTTRRSTRSAEFSWAA
jgi:NAD(P)-dependent dehydrogenase (short-subunit alcohol dehydrogenase family)